MHFLKTEVELSNVSVELGGCAVLRNVHLSIVTGETVVICGPSGSGKTTLLRTVAGMVPLKAGTLRIGGEEWKHGRLSGLKPGYVGMVFQGAQLYPHLRVLDNITLGPRLALGMSRNAAELRAFALLEQVGLQSKHDKFPQELSGGERQRVAIVRTLAMDPGVILFDEPTSALDPSSTKGISQIIREIAKADRTVILVTHETGLARMVADRIVCMEDGLIRETGIPHEIIVRPHSDTGLRLFADTSPEISNYDRVRYTRSVIVGVADIGIDDVMSMPWVENMRHQLKCEVVLRVLSIEEVPLMLRMGSVDVYISRHMEKILDKPYVEHLSAKDCHVFLTATDSVWLRCLDSFIQHQCRSAAYLADNATVAERI